ncbi:hypothetical protein FSP39_001058 [Pinctada imbricata]|uniref:Uncharacterized protein n=1 Tax=Pinctada imbricata TaxID=66713 RepID=A0AA89BR09_PINIB|nr:hypothetical protein FSP39_001058 [Pinctada imbricata]
MEVEIVHNGNGMVYTYSGGETMYGSGSTSAVLQLHVNDDVWNIVFNFVHEHRRRVRLTKQGIHTPPGHLIPHLASVDVQFGALL